MSKNEILAKNLSDGTNEKELLLILNKLTEAEVETLADAAFWCADRRGHDYLTTVEVVSDEWL